MNALRQISEIKLGLLALGIFVGWLLGYVLLLSKKPNLKMVITVLGAALAGAPVAFMQGVQQKWMYPIGLLIGLMYTRALGARNAIALKQADPNPQNKVHGIFAWIDLLVIAVVAIAATAIGIFSE